MVKLLSWSRLLPEPISAVTDFVTTATATAASSDVLAVEPLASSGLAPASALVVTLDCPDAVTVIFVVGALCAVIVALSAMRLVVVSLRTTLTPKPAPIPTLPSPASSSSSEAGAGLSSAVPTPKAVLTPPTKAVKLSKEDKYPSIPLKTRAVSPTVALPLTV